MADPKALAAALARAPDVSAAQQIRSMLAPRPATARPYEPTNRERLAAAIIGDSKPGSIRHQIADGLVGDGLSRLTGLLDFTPAGLGFADESARKTVTPGQRGQGVAELAAILLPGAAKGLGGALKGAERTGLGAMAHDLAPQAERVTPPIIAYHGSPHTFDQFDAAKIGTGEGAQAYGHGLYFAENEKVAKEYRDNLADEEWHVDGVPYDADRADHRAAESLARFQERGGDKYSLMQDLLAKRREYEAKGSDWGNLGAAKIQEELNALASGTVGRFEAKTKGSVYQVGINAQPEHFLDWDRPLSEQHQVVRDAVTALDHPTIKGWQESGALPYVKGETVYRQLAGGLTKGAAARGEPVTASEMLQGAGIPGIRYRDAGSRGVDGGSGTHNYVVFSPEVIEILKRYGLPLGIGAGATGAALTQPQPTAPNPTSGIANMVAKPIV